MAAVVHIPVHELELALERARAGDSVVLDDGEEVFYLNRGGKKSARTWDISELGPIHIERTDFRPLGEILADPTVQWSGIVMDDQWASDMEAIMAENRAHDRDPWAE